MASAEEWAVESFFIPSSASLSVATEKRVEEYRSFRAQILHDEGRRPEFRALDGSYVDQQALDQGAWHFGARHVTSGQLMAYIRLATPTVAEQFQSHAFLGTSRLAALLADQRVDAKRVFEHSRLVVAPTARGMGLGAYMYALAMAAARDLDAEAMIGISGTADGQHMLYERFGFDIIPGTRSYVSHYGEEVCVIFNRTDRGAGAFEDLVRSLRYNLAHQSYGADLSVAEVPV